MRRPVLTLALAVGAALLCACPPESGRILGDTPGIDDALSTCQVECRTAADCPIQSDLYRAGDYRWTCDGGICVGVQCFDDNDCGGGGTRCRDGSCQKACVPPSDTCTPPPACCGRDDGCCGGEQSALCCPWFNNQPLYIRAREEALCCYDGTLCCDDPAGCCPDPRDACVDGYCARQPEVSRPPCTGDADCADACTNPPEGAGCGCKDDGTCGFTSPPVCDGDADCANQLFLFGSIADADNAFCDAGDCHFKGCNDDGECAEVFPGATCDPANHTCTMPCTATRECRPLEIARRLGLVTAATVCREGMCRFDDTCLSDADCLLARNGRCTLAPDRSPGYCRYNPAACFDDGDCFPWERCRENRCGFFQSDVDSGGGGRICGEDGDCALLQMAQSLYNSSGPWPYLSAQIDAPEACGLMCLATADCPAGTTCTALPVAGPFDALPGERTACLPTGCTAAGGCPASFAPCKGDQDCARDERCAWPVSQCAGVCLATACTACSAWLAASTEHTCSGEGIDISTQIIRPD